MLHFDEFWIGPAQLALTAALARSTASIPGEAIEVGTWQGLSAIPLARAVAPSKLHVVDHWKGDEPEAGIYGIERHRVERDNYGTFLANIREARVADGIDIHKMGWREFIAGWNQPIRFVHIDASHTADEVSDNIEAFLPLASEGAVFCGDDYGFPQVSEGVHRHFPDCHSSENKLWWKVIGDSRPGLKWAAHAHSLTHAGSYQRDLMRIREMYMISTPEECPGRLAMSGSTGTY